MLNSLEKTGFIDNPAFDKRLKLMFIFTAASYIIIDYCIRLSVLSGFSNMWDELVLLAAFAFIVPARWRTGEKVRFGGLLGALALFYAVFLALMLFQTDDFSAAFLEFRTVVQGSLWMVLGVNLIDSRDELRVYIDVFLVAGFLVALYGIYQYYIGVEIPANWVDKAESALRTRVFSVINSPNALGSFLVMQISVGVASFLSVKGRYQKYFYALTVLTAMACLVFTFSRAAWFLCAASIFMMGLLVDRRLLLAMAAGALIIPVMVPSVAGRITYLFSSTYVDSSSSAGRISAWSKALDYWSAFKLTGLGLGKFGGGAALYSYGASFSVDNYYLKLLVESGIAGLGSFLILILGALGKITSRFYKPADRYVYCMAVAMLASVLCILVHCLFENLIEFPGVYVYFWFFLGVLLNIDRIGPVLETGEPIND